jgi:site-specific recombinase XerD
VVLSRPVARMPVASSRSRPNDRSPCRRYWRLPGREGRGLTSADARGTIPANRPSKLGARWRTRISQAKEAFLKSIEHTRSKATQAAYDSDLTRFIGFLVSNSVLAFTRDRLEAYFHALASEGLSRATLHRKQACLRMFARFGLTHGLWTADPTAGLASIPKPKRVPRPFSDDETHALMALDLQPREKVVRALLIYTGLRVSPLCSIKLGDISYAPPAIRVLVKSSKVQVVKMHGGLAELVKAYAVAHTDLKGQTFLLAYYPDITRTGGT